MIRVIYISDYHRKRRVRSLTARAIKKGLLERLPCEECAAPKSEAHHPDYNQPLLIIWLCKEHHDALHVSLRIQRKQLST